MFTVLNLFYENVKKHNFYWRYLWIWMLTNENQSKAIIWLIRTMASYENKALTSNLCDCPSQSTKIYMIWTTFILITIRHINGYVADRNILRKDIGRFKDILIFEQSMANKNKTGNNLRINTYIVMAGITMSRTIKSVSHQLRRDRTCLFPNKGLSV